MSLPRRPNAGLPTNPRGRSSIDGRQDYPPRPRSSASERPPPSAYAAPALPSQPRGIRPQRSLTNLPSTPASGARSRSLDRRSEGRSYASSDAPPVPALPGLPRGVRSSVTQDRREREYQDDRRYREERQHREDRDYREERSYREDRGRGPSARAPSRGPSRAPSRGPAPVSQRSRDYSTHRRMESDYDSASSSGRSDMFERGPGSVASSRTSLDSRDMDDKMDDEKTPAGFGSSLWSSLSGVANNLSNWYGGASSTADGEAPGEESHLTRVMKAYYIEKARGPADLPEWLFDERERGLRSRNDEPDRNRDRDRDRDRRPPQDRDPRAMDPPRSTSRRDDPPPPPRPTRGPTLADRKDSAPAAATAGRTRRAYDGDGGEAHITKSMSRLRELRDAKRSATLRFKDDHDHDHDGDSYEDARGYAAAPPPPAAQAPVRAPLAMDMRPGVRSNGVGMQMQAAPLGASVGVRGRQPLGLPSGVRGRA